MFIDTNYREDFAEIVQVRGFDGICFDSGTTRANAIGAVSISVRLRLVNGLLK